MMDKIIRILLKYLAKLIMAFIHRLVNWLVKVLWAFIKKRIGR